VDVVMERRSGAMCNMAGKIVQSIGVRT
jgi:hypothetical protein